MNAPHFEHGWALLVMLSVGARADDDWRDHGHHHHEPVPVAEPASWQLVALNSVAALGFAIQRARR